MSSHGNIQVLFFFFSFKDSDLSVPERDCFAFIEICKYVKWNVIIVTIRIPLFLKKIVNFKKAFH